jgi:hypothetical protein
MPLRHVVDPGRGDHDAAMAEARHVLTEAREHVLGAQAKLSRLKSPFGAVATMIVYDERQPPSEVTTRWRRPARASVTWDGAHRTHGSAAVEADAGAWKSMTSPSANGRRSGTLVPTGRARATAGWGIRVHTRRGSATMTTSTNHRQPKHIENDLAVIISVDELKGQTRAMARLQFDGEEWIGAGLSRLSPAERGTAGTGGQLAIARALSDLARHLARSPVRP